jgi:RimJ/RimL family protein N-acetyltransferase
MTLSVREIRPADFDKFLSYWYDNSEEFMVGMGVEVAKIPSRENFLALLDKVVNLPYNEKPGFILIWEDAGVPVGHSNINQIVFGEKASMHLHMWNSAKRKKGLGTEFVRLCLPHYFEKFKLKELICEPAVKNPAPNKTLPKLGFEYVNTYFGAPGILMYEQEVNVYRLDRDKFRQM